MASRISTVDGMQFFTEIYTPLELQKPPGCTGEIRTRVDEVLYEGETPFQEVVIFNSPRLGKVLALDGVIQTTEADEYVYHEMLVHVPFLAHGNVRSVLIIGGGDGGTLRHCLMHPIEKATMVEIDAVVVEKCRALMPNLSQGAFNDPRTTLRIEDGIHYMRDTVEKFDVVIVDCSDPEGPSHPLFTSDFYQYCHRVLNPGGVLVAQGSTLFDFCDHIRDVCDILRPIFQDTTIYHAHVPTYLGGDCAYFWATDNKTLRQTGLGVLQARQKAAGIKAKFYNPETHQASFVLPEYVKELLNA